MYFRIGELETVLFLFQLHKLQVHPPYFGIQHVCPCKNMLNTKLCKVVVKVFVKHVVPLCHVQFTERMRSLVVEISLT